MIQSLSHFQHEKLTKKKKKKFEDAQIAEKKVSDDGYANGRLFFFSLREGAHLSIITKDEQVPSLDKPPP